MQAVSVILMNLVAYALMVGKAKNVDLVYALLFVVMDTCIYPSTNHAQHKQPC